MLDVTSLFTTSRLAAAAAKDAARDRRRSVRLNAYNISPRDGYHEQYNGK